MEVWLRFQCLLPHDQQRLLGMVRAMIEAGLIRHLLFSHDVCYKSMCHAYGGPGYDFISLRLMDRLKEIGVTEEQFHQIMVDNPRRALTGEE